MKAKDVMTTRFWRLKADDTIAEAVNRFKEASRDQGRMFLG